jgi:hypothetical protein
MKAIQYICDGLSPVRAGDIAHAAQLFAVQLARSKYGPKGRCRSMRTVLDTPAEATFEAFIGVPNGIAWRATSHVSQCAEADGRSTRAAGRATNLAGLCSFRRGAMDDRRQND